MMSDEITLHNEMAVGQECRQDWGNPVRIASNHYHTVVIEVSAVIFLLQHNYHLARKYEDKN